MIGKQDDLGRFSRIVQIYVTMRVRILVRTDRSGEQFHSCNPFTRLGAHVRERPLVSGKRLVFRPSWKWRERSAVKITERTHEKDAQALHGRREGRHPEAAPAGAGADLVVV